MPITPTPDPEPIPTSGVTASSRVRVVLYSPDGNPKGRSFRPKDVLAARWRVTRLSGYADASLTVAGLPADHPGLVNDACIEIWGFDDVQQAYVRLYRGYVLQALGRARTSGTPRQTEITLYGFWDRLARQIALQRYMFVQPTDISDIFADLMGRWADSADIGFSYAVSPNTTGFTLDALDAYYLPLSAVIERLDSAASHQIVAGADVNPGGANRAYLRPFDTAPSLVASLPDPSNHIELIESGQDARQRVNALFLRGGKDPYPNLFEAMTRTQDGATGGGNSSFESPRRAGSGYGNLIKNGGFEDGFLHWSASGASVKDTGDPEGPAYEGVKLMETDHDDEAVVQDITTTNGIVGGKSYTFAFAAKAETSAGVPPEGRISLIWRDGTTPLGAYTITIGGGIPVPATWTDYKIPAIVAPLDANQVQIIIEAPVSDINFGLHWDAFQMWQEDLLHQESWEGATLGGGTFGRIDWAVDNPINPAGLPRRPFHGGYCVFVEVLSAGLGDPCILRPREGASAGVQGGNAYRFSKWSLSPQGESFAPARRLVMEERDKDNTVIGTYRKDLPSVAAFAEWTQESFTRTLSQSCRFVRCWEEYVEGSDLTPGRLYSDAFQLRDARAAADEFVEGEQYEAILRTDDAVLALTPPTSTSIATLGLWPERVVEEALINQSDARAWGRAALLERALAQIRARVVWVGSPTLPGSADSPWPGQVVKAIGSIGSAVLPTAYPIAELEGEWQETNGAMLLRLTASLVTDPETEARVLSKIIQRERIQQGQGRR